MREAILQQINLVRAGGFVCGTQLLPAATAVAWNDVLFSGAARHSQDMAVRNYFSHTTPEGVDFAQRLASEGYSGWIEGENIAAGLGSVATVMSTWMGSEGHCRNIMQPQFREVAVACVMRPGTTYGTYWSMELGAR